MAGQGADRRGGIEPLNKLLMATPRFLCTAATVAHASHNAPSRPAGVGALRRARVRTSDAP